MLRIGAGYHDLQIAGHLSESSPAFAVSKDAAPSGGISLSSAAAIRAALYEGIDVRSEMPVQAFALLKEELSAGRFLTSTDLDLALRLSLYERRSSLADYVDVSEDLANRILHLLPQYTGYDPFCALLKTKQIAYTRVRRALLHILLGLKKTEKPQISCARVLGFRRSAKPLLSRIKKEASIPLVTKLPPEDAISKQMQEDLAATDLWELLVSHKTVAPARSERQRQIIIL